MPKYTINHTDVNKTAKEVDEGSVDDYSLDIALFGRIRLEYGERLNQNLLNLLENFSSDADPSVVPVTPTPMPSVSITPSGFAVSPTPTPTVTRSPTRTASPSPSAATPTPTASVTRTPTPTPVTPTPTPTVTVSPTVGVSPTPTPSPTRTVTPTVSVTTTVTPTPSAVSTINLDDIPELTAFSGSVPAWGSLTFNPDGTFDVEEHFGPDNGLTGNWTSGIGSAYELYYTYSDVSSPAYGDPGPGDSMWIQMDSPIVFSASDAVTSDYVAINVSITIRKISDHADTKSMTLLIDIDGACFAYGTQLLTPSGLVAIQDLNIGDTVSSYTVPTMIDEDQDGWKDWTTTDISGMSMTISTVTGKKIFSSPNGISINGLVTTTEHIYFVYSDGKYGWKNANNVTMDDKLVDMNGTLLDITEILPVSGAQYVALDVETDDTLIAFDGERYILAHNVSA